MEYLTVEQYAKAQNAHPRMVQRRCRAGLIPGARKLGNNWLIPKQDNSAKLDAQKTQSSDSSAIYLAIASGQADAYLRSLPRNSTYHLTHGLFSYYRCEYEQALSAFDQLEPTDEEYLVGKLFSLYAALSLGDFVRYRNIRPLFNRPQTKELIAPEKRRILECFQANINVSILVVQGIPDWLKKGDLSSLPPTMRDLAWYTYIKYLQVIKDYRVMLAAAEARISTQKPGYYSLGDIYAYLYAALGHLKQDNLALARERMMTILDLALPDRFISPFVETLAIMQGLTERCLAEAFPQQYNEVIDQWNRVSFQWLKAHNELSVSTIPDVLTLREHQVASYAADGLTNSQIAQKMYISLSAVKKDLSCIYGKLGISCRRQLKDMF